MDMVLRLLSGWYNLLTRAFTEHTISAAVITIAAVGVFILLEHEYRRQRLLTNVLFVLLGWIVAITLLPVAMAAAGKAVAGFETTLPLASRIFGYLRGIYERHPILVLVIVGLGATSYFLKQSWPYQVSWGPVRAVCTVFGIVLMVHIAGPIADLIDGEALAAPKAQKFVAPKVPAKEAVVQAVKSGDLRYLSVPQCVEEVSGYPVSAQAVRPASAAVRKLGPSCDEMLGNEGAARVRTYREYAAEYNRLMYEHNKAAEPKVAEAKAAEGGGTDSKVGESKQ